MDETVKDRYLSVYKWATAYTAEARKGNVLGEYYWSDSIKRLLFKLKNSEGSIIALVGLQGTGKSMALCVISEILESPYLYWKWGKEVLNRIREESSEEEGWERCIYQVLADNQDRFIQEKLQIDPHYFRHLVKQLSKPEARQGALQELRQIIEVEHAAKLLDKKSLEELKDVFLLKLLKRTKYILVDLPDYKKTDAHSFGKDLDFLQKLWNNMLLETGQIKPTFLISFQKELVMKRPHFFIGKMNVVELKPLKPEELVEAYKLKWGTAEPFTEDGLHLVAELGRGVFRRFLKYIQASIENFIITDKTQAIDIADVKAAISEEMLLADMELELSDIFCKHLQVTQAVKIIIALRENPLNQKEIASLLNISESTAGRLISKLETYNYVKRNRGEGKMWVISLN